MTEGIHKNILPELSICIPVYNEAENLGALIESILIQQGVASYEIIFVISGCADNSIGIAKKYQNSFDRFYILEEKERSGKAYAINLFFKKASGRFCILLSSDIVLEKGCLRGLIEPFKNEVIGMSGAHVIFVPGNNSLPRAMNDMLWQMHHFFNGLKPKLGEAVAFRNILKEIPPTTAVDEVSIEAFFFKNGYKLYYCDKAVVYNKCPVTVKDLFIQRERIFWGHLDVKKTSGYSAASMDLILILRVVYEYVIKNAGHLSFALISLCLLEVLSRFSACFKYYVLHRRPPFKWQAYKKL